MADPGSDTPVLSSFTYKQLIHSTFMGGGLWTATGVLLVSKFGNLPVFILSSSISLTFFCMCMFYHVPQAKREAERMAKDGEESGDAAESEARLLYDPASS